MAFIKHLCSQSGGIMSIDFSNVIGTLGKKRLLERTDLLAINQSFLAIGETCTPMQETVEGLFARFVSPHILTVLRNIAERQDTTQKLTYQNSSQAAKEMASMLILSCLLPEGSIPRNVEKSVKEQVDYGVLALSLRYYKAERVPTFPSKGRFAETYYLANAIADKLLDGLSHDEQTLVTDILLMTAPEHREDETFKDEPLIYRNASDAVVFPFIGISFELNLSDKIRMTAQSKRGLGENITYAKRIRQNMTPFGNAKGTAIETFIDRMVSHGTSPRMKTGNGVIG